MMRTPCWPGTASTVGASVPIRVLHQVLVHAQASPFSSGAGFMSSGTAAMASSNRARLSVRLEGTEAATESGGRDATKRSIGPSSGRSGAEASRRVRVSQPHLPATSHPRHSATPCVAPTLCSPRGPSACADAAAAASRQERSPGRHTSPPEMQVDLRRFREVDRRETAWPQPSDSNVSA